MKLNQKKLSKEEIINQCRLQGATKFYQSGSNKIQEQKDIMNYSFKHQFDRVKQRLHKSYLKRYGSKYSVQAEPELGLTELRNGTLLSDHSQKNRGSMFVQSP